MASSDGSIGLLIGGFGSLLGGLALISLAGGTAGSTLVLGGTLLVIAAIGVMVAPDPANALAGP
jgi:hypothetical protein